MVIKLPFTATLKGHIQILNPLLVGDFRKIRAEDFIILFFRSNYAPRFGEIWCFLTIRQKQKALQINICRAFERFE
jgi:hypothetical protein